MDNATLHATKDDPAWIKAKKAWVFDIQLVRQPPQSPDTNVLDLGIWNSLQSIQRKLPLVNASSLEYQLVKDVQKAWMELTLTTVNSCFITLKNILQEIRENKDGNQFKTPRKRKYAHMIGRSNYIIDAAASDNKTVTVLDDDGDGYMETKPAALRVSDFVVKQEGEKAASI